MALSANTRARIEKGCNARGITKGCTVLVTEVTEMGAEYGHSVRVLFTVLNGFKSGTKFAFWARHKNRLGDLVISMNDGNPLHVIKIRQVAAATSEPAK